MKAEEFATCKEALHSTLHFCKNELSTDFSEMRHIDQNIALFPSSTTCKPSEGVIHSTIESDFDDPQGSRRSILIFNDDATFAVFNSFSEHTDQHLCYQHPNNNHFRSEETRSSGREYNNNKLDSTAPLAPEDLDNDGVCPVTGTTTSFLLSSRTAATASASPPGRFSARRLNIFHMSSFLLLLFCVSLAGVTGVRINSLTVPQIIRNGTEDSVILDCDYTVDDHEKKGLVVKWFHEKKQFPVYQWIPNQKPIDLGILKGKLNLDFTVGSDEFKSHRALQIIRPTIELSGNWICEVSTWEGEAVEVARMIIFAPEKDMGIHVSENRRDGRVNVSCWATNVFPEPRLALFREDQEVEDLMVSKKLNLNSGAYDINAYKIIEDANLSAPVTTYECELKIPSTNYVRRQTKQYEPGSLELRDEMAMGSAGGLSPMEFFSMSAFYFWILLVITLTFSMTSATVLLQEAAPAASSSSLLFFCL